MKKEQQHFYGNLPNIKLPLSDLLISKKYFKPVPKNWLVLITDIKSSTLAVQNGGAENVNFIATGSIVTVLNIAFKERITVPFFFGGDGATFILPPNVAQEAIVQLTTFKQTVKENYALELRVGSVLVADIFDAGYELKISKFLRAKGFAIPVVLGHGLAYAEKCIKDNDDDGLINDLSENLDLSGMQCRWDKISPPNDDHEVISLIVSTPLHIDQAVVFSKVIALLDRIYGSVEKRQPISVPKLIFRTSFNNLRQEMKVAIGKINLYELLKTWAINLYGLIYFKTQSGKNYLKRLVEMSDTLVLDGRINTIITGTEKQRLALQAELDKLEHTGEIIYGICVSSESVMSCYVRDLVDDHIHFVDGGESGYTRAAGEMKRKISANIGISKN